MSLFLYNILQKIGFYVVNGTGNGEEMEAPVIINSIYARGRVVIWNLHSMGS